MAASSKYGRNASWMSSASLTKSRTARSAWLLRSAVRLSRDSVCTAEMPVSFLLTYIVVSSGWSKPVWYFSATTRMRYSGLPAPPALHGLVVGTGVGERLGQRALRQAAVLLGLGGLLAVVGERAGERDQHARGRGSRGRRCSCLIARDICTALLAGTR